MPATSTTRASPRLRTTTNREVVLAKYELHPNYCGELQYFAQYTDAYALIAGRG